MKTRAWKRVSVATSFRIDVTGNSEDEKPFKFSITTTETGDYQYTYDFEDESITTDVQFEQYIGLFH